jgi:hypothetical protein
MSGVKDNVVHWWPFRNGGWSRTKLCDIFFPHSMFGLWRGRQVGTFAFSGVNAFNTLVVLTAYPLMVSHT